MHNPAGPITRREIVSDYLIRYPLRYCAPIFTGILARDEQRMLSTGTATLLKIGERALLVTDDHVLEHYIDEHEANPRVCFQVGARPFDPLEYLVDRNKQKDICTLDASSLVFEDETRHSDRMPPLEFYAASEDAWPPAPVQMSDVVIFGGFPGAFRSQESFDVVSRSYSMAATPVTGVMQDYFTCNLDRSHWQTENGRNDPNIQLRDWGGMSGGPVLVDGEKTLRPHLVGFIMEYERFVDQLKASHAALVRKDGTIERGTLF
jgi:hypothetical protein